MKCTECGKEVLDTNNTDSIFFTVYGKYICNECVNIKELSQYKKYYGTSGRNKD